MAGQWSEIPIGSHAMPIQVGEFGVKSLFSYFKLSELTGRHFKWFVDSKSKVVKIEFNSRYAKVAKELIGIPSFVRKFFAERDAIAFRDENAIYLSPYELGEEHLKKFLENEGIIKRK